jgi:hypothetical protein
MVFCKRWKPRQLQPDRASLRLWADYEQAGSNPSKPDLRHYFLFGDITGQALPILLRLG